MKLSEELTERGFIHQIAGESLADIVDGPKRVVYHGVDPTSDSIHAGNFVQFLLLRHLVKNGHKVILLIGGGTGMIGDPKPDVERPLTSPEIVAERAKKLSLQASRLLGTEIEVVNNYDWLGKINLIDFLRDVGKHFTVNELIKKDAIATRLKSEQGLSYTEFAYPLLQGYDYLMLNQEKGCDLQTGGSDQWGNIVAGVDLVRKKNQKEVYALTVPLIIDKATGKKFGKSEGNAVWLDAEKTSPYDFYQFWLNCSDESVVDYLKLFTLLSLSEIEEVAAEFVKDPSQRLAQKTLAYEVTKMVHGEELSLGAANVSKILFRGGDLSELSLSEVEMLKNNVLASHVGVGTNFVDILVDSGLASSKREARNFVEEGAVVIGDRKLESVEDVLKKDDFVASGIALLRRGKKKYCILLMSQ